MRERQTHRSVGLIEQAEARLGIALPSSFRNFLLQPHRPPSLHDLSLRRVDDLCWARDDPEVQEYMAGWDEGAGEAEEVSEAQHRASSEDPTLFRRAYVEESLLFAYRRTRQQPCAAATPSIPQITQQ